MTKSDHVVMADNGRGFVCTHCGEKHAVVLPMRVDLFAAVCKAFARLHRDCKPVQP